MTQTSPLRIDIVSDVVCPWCVVGYLQLAQALEREAMTAEIVWQPFELNTAMVADGQELRAHITEKYGSSRADSDRARDHITRTGAELGFTFDFKEGGRIYNTFVAHQLLHWAIGHGQQHALKMALFDAYFTHGEDVSDLIVLADTAASVGLNRDEALAVMRDGRYAVMVREEQRFFTDQGISGVPGIIFDRKYLVSGAQGADAFVQVLQKIRETEPAD